MAPVVMAIVPHCDSATTMASTVSATYSVRTTGTIVPVRPTRKTSVAWIAR